MRKKGNRFIDLTGKKFGRLTVVELASKNKRGVYYWLCRCECKNTKVIRGGHLREGIIKSCGCLRKELTKQRQTTHGMLNTSEYKIWLGMKTRCSNKNTIGYKDYGSRGITVCERWLKFENFFEDMGERPQNKTLDRINNNSEYSKMNCRWATWKENNRNRRDNKMITYKGKTFCIAEWAERLNIKYYLLWNRLNKGWNIEKAFTK